MPIDLPKPQILQVKDLNRLIVLLEFYGEFADYEMDRDKLRAEFRRLKPEVESFIHLLHGLKG